MVWIQTYFQYCSLYLLSILTFYFIGRFLRFIAAYQNLRTTTFTQLFINLFVGTVFVAIIVSLYFARLKTVHLLYGLVVPAFLLALRRKNEMENDHPAEEFMVIGRRLPELLLYALVLYTIFAFGIIRRQDWSSLLSVPHLVDWGLYSVDMQTLVETGQENSYHVHTILSQDYHGLTPYHYVTLWLGGFLFSLFPGLTPFYLLTLIIYPLLGFLALTGSWAFVEQLKTKFHWYHRLLPLVCVFTSGVLFLPVLASHQSYQSQFLTTTMRDLNGFLFYMPKRFISYSAFLIFSLLFLRKKYFAGMVSLLIVPLVSIDVAPAVFGGVLIYGIINYRKKFLPVAEMHRLWLLYAVFAILLFLLYKAFGNEKILLYNPQEALRQSIFSVSAWMIPLLYFFRGLILILALYSLHLGFIYWNQKRPLSKESIPPRFFLMLGVMMLSGLLAWSVFYSYIDAIQFTNGTLAILQTVMLLCLLSRLGEFRKGIRILILSYITMNAAYNLVQHYVT
ncbi:hypothetical protein L0156_24025, partial [bacterium]|nr:hypothetical protein [bacterium]